MGRNVNVSEGTRGRKTEGGTDRGVRSVTIANAKKSSAGGEREVEREVVREG